MTSWGEVFGPCCAPDNNIVKIATGSEFRIDLWKIVVVVLFKIAGNLLSLLTPALICSQGYSCETN